MLVIEAEGSPYKIGHRHGTQARYAIFRSITFYEDLFRKSAGLAWPQVRQAATPFAETIREQWPEFWEEMRGIAEGSGKDVLDIVALNTRTEITFGMLNDGCTSMYTRTGAATLLGQNWDWMEAQKENLIYMTIKQRGKPAIKMITEAGLIGKIGLNSNGLGVCFNALRIPGVSSTKIPAHLALRLALRDHSTARSAASALEKLGLAAACFLLLGDAREAVGVECTAQTVHLQEMKDVGAGGKALVHSNHLLLDHGTDAPKDPGLWIENSSFRASRMATLAESVVSAGNDAKAQKEVFAACFEDEKGYPGSICRAVKLPEVETASLFNIVMDLGARRAVVKQGRAIAPEEQYVLDFGGEKEVAQVESRL